MDSDDEAGLEAEEGIKFRRKSDNGKNKIIDVCGIDDEEEINVRETEEKEEIISKRQEFQDEECQWKTERESSADEEYIGERR